MSYSVVQYVKLFGFWYFTHPTSFSHIDRHTFIHTHTHRKTHSSFSINPTAILKWIILNLSNSSLHIFATLNQDIAGWTAIRAELFSQLSSEELSIEGLYFNIASKDVQHYKSWVAPHFTQPNGLTLRAHWGSRQGSFPSFLWSKFYETQGLGLIESHSELQHVEGFTLNAPHWWLNTSNDTSRPFISLWYVFPQILRAPFAVLNKNLTSQR